MGKNKSARPLLIFLTQFYDPEPVYKGQAFAEAVMALGYNVEVVTGFPNYPSGKVYDGYRIRIRKRSSRNGIKITRLALYPSHGKSKLGRVTNYLSFFFSAFIYLCWAARRANIVYVYNPPLTVGLAATASRFFHRAPVVVDIHDLWPDTLPATGMITNPQSLRWIGRAANWMYSKAQFIILHTQGFRMKLIERGVPEEKMQTVIGWTHENGALEEGAVQPEELDRLASAKGLKLLYAGNIGPAQSLETVLNVAAKLQAHGDTDLVTFCFLGDGISKTKLEQIAHDRGLRNVLFLPRVTSSAVGHFLSAADALLVHLRADPLFEITLPSKTQAYMYAGKPVLMAINGEASSLISAARAGVTAIPQNVESIAEAVLTLAKMSSAERNVLGEAGRRYYDRELAMEKGMEQFARIFEKVRR
jgi:glycosyltransferase involved in cell wall biosynthesis